MAGAGRPPATLALLASLGVSLAAVPRGGLGGDAAGDFHAYMAEYGRPYARGSHEYHERIALFALRSSEVEAHNSLPGRLWTAGINALSDRTEAELAQLRGWRGVAAPSQGRSAGLLESGSSTGAFLGRRGGLRAPPREHLSWAKLRAAKSFDQGGCGSCWAVATSKVLQLHTEIYNPSSNRTFSPQELVSCVPNPHECGGTGGCKGATVELALDWALKRGLAQESETPYRAQDLKCKKTAAGSDGLVQLSGHIEDVASVGVHEAPPGAPGSAFGMAAWERLEENGYDALLRAVSERGPVGISVAARPWAMYSSGVFDGCEGNWVIDHAVVLLGYGKDEATGALFYLVQNSWGDGWGEHGRIRLLRRKDDAERCGMDKQPEAGTGCKGGPKEVKVCGACGILYDNAVPHFKRLAA